MRVLGVLVEHIVADLQPAVRTEGPHLNAEDPVREYLLRCEELQDGERIVEAFYVGAFAFIFGNFALLSTIIFDSFASLGLNASAAGFSPADLLRPGLVAAEELAASQPIFDHRKVSGATLTEDGSHVPPHIARRLLS